MIRESEKSEYNEDKNASEIADDIYEVYRYFIEELQYKPHEVDQICIQDFERIFATKKRKKRAGRRAEAGQLTPEQMMALT